MAKMEQYEKWLKGKAGIGWYTGTAEGWIAALEWMKERCSGAFDFTSTDIDYIVDEELNGD